MKTRLLLVFCSISMLIGSQSFAQKDSLKLKKKDRTYLKENLVPLSLLVAGTAISSSKFEQNLQRDIRNLVGNRYSTQVDNYIRYAPIAEIVIADVLGVEAKNHWFDQAKNWTISWLVTDWLTFRLKDWVGKPRPDAYDNFSFPSGHTSFTFMNAEVLYQEFRDTSPWLAYSGYAFAATTGGLRIANNAHFVSDVMFGAGLAMLITKLVYWLDPLIKWNPFKRVKDVTFYPQRLDQKTVGVYFSLRL